MMGRIAERRVIGIVRADGPEPATRAALSAVDAGLDVVEVSLTTPGALEAIAEVAAARPDALIGAGTVLDEASARLAVLAGASFLVSPTLHAAVVSTGHRFGLVVIPGAATATEILAALELGADAVKLFPARASSPGVLRDLLQALPQAPIVPTGGVDGTNAADWLAAGAVAVGVGGALTGGPSAVGALLEAVGAR